MANVKGSDIVNLRSLFRNYPDMEKELISKLPADVIETYQKTLHTSMVPTNMVSSIFKSAAEIMYPGQKDRLHLLSRDLAKVIYSGIYKIFLRIPSIKFIMSRAASIWKTYYDKGEGSIENESENSCDFVVTGFSDLETELRAMVPGNICVLLEMAGLKKIRVNHIDSNPKKWIWQVSWEK